MNQVCCVCNEGSLAPYSEASWDVDGQKYLLGQCSACGSVYTDPLPHAAALKKLYETGFSYTWYADHLWAKLKDCRQRFQEYAPFLGRRVLDYGGGLGYFSQVARENGYHSVTFDPYAGNAQLDETPWDTLVCLHMLEHANDLDVEIQKIKGLLVDGGKLVLVVPNFSGDGYQKLGMGWVWAQPPLLHIFHFTAAGLVKLLQRHGFTDLQVDFHDRWDANSQSDIREVERFRKLDGDWHKPLFKSFRLFQKMIAFRNSILRFKALEKAQNTSVAQKYSLSELQIVCTKQEHA